MNPIQTHKNINQELCGVPLLIEEGVSKVKLETKDSMAVDSRGLVHGGFVFGLADYAAMIAVNHPNVVLGASEVKFKSPVSVGETITAEAKVMKSERKKQMVEVIVRKDDIEVFIGSFTCFILDSHVLNR